MKRRNFLLVLLMILLVVSTVIYAQFEDQPSDWSEEYINRAVEMGFLKGDQNKIRPKDKIKRVEVAIVLNRVLNTYEEVNITGFDDIGLRDWHYKDSSRAVAAGFLKGSASRLNPLKPATREEVFTMMGRVFAIESKSNSLEDFTDASQVSAWSKKYINGLIDRGYVEGFKSKIKPKDKMTRAEFAKIISCLIEEQVKESGSHKLNVDGNLLVNEGSIVLEDSRIKGDLILGEGLRKNKVQLKNVKVDGNIVKRHGGKLQIDSQSSYKALKEKEKVNFKPNIKVDKNQKVAVLLYHHVLSQKDMKKYGWENNAAVISLENFTRQMNYLKSQGYTSITTDELDQFIKGKIRLPKKSVLITFDDGYLSNSQLAYKVLKKNKQKASLFMIGKTTSNKHGDFHPKKLQFMNLADMEKAKDVFEYQCHTFDAHKLMNGLVGTKALSHKELVKDLEKNKKLLKSSSIAYPRGYNDDKVRRAVKDVGYKTGFTVKPGYVKYGTNSYQIPRFIIHPNTSFKEFKKIVDI